MSEKLSVHALRHQLDNPGKRRDVLFVKDVPPKPKRTYAEWAEALYQRRLEKLAPKKQGNKPWTS